ncbi:hypothetical protein GCM10018987_56260 [Streptomyces cremeus]
MYPRPLHHLVHRALRVEPNSLRFAWCADSPVPEVLRSEGMQQSGLPPEWGGSPELLAMSGWGPGLRGFGGCGARWSVKRAFAHPHWFRRLRVRWEIRDDIHEAFLALGYALICWRRLNSSREECLSAFTRNAGAVTPVRPARSRRR